MAPINSYKNPESTRVDLTVLTEDAFEPRKVFTRTVGQSVLIGRASKIPAQNADPDSALYRNQVLSREHAFLSWRTTGIMLRDNKSTHGTSIRRTQDGVSSVFELAKGIDTPLHHGDIVILGKQITRLEPGSKEMVDYAPLMLQVGLEGGSLRSRYASKLSQSSTSHKAYGLSASEQVASDEDCRDLPPPIKSAAASSIVVIDDSSDSNDGFVVTQNADRSSRLVNAVKAKAISPPAPLFSASSDANEVNTAKTATITALPVQDSVMECSRDSLEAAHVNTYSPHPSTNSQVLTRSDRAKLVVASPDESNDELPSLPPSSFGDIDSPSAVLDKLDTSSDVMSSQAQESADVSLELEEPQSLRKVYSSDEELNGVFDQEEASSEEDSEMEDEPEEVGSDDASSDAASVQDSEAQSEVEESSVYDSEEEEDDEVSETSSQIFDQSSQADTESRFKKRRRISSSSIEQDLDSDSTDIKKFEDSIMDYDAPNFDLSQTPNNEAAREEGNETSSVPPSSDSLPSSETLSSDNQAFVHGREVDGKGRPPSTLRQVNIVRDAATQVEAPTFTTIAVQTGTSGKDAYTQFEHAMVPGLDTVELSSKKRSFDAMTATEPAAQNQETVGSVEGSTVAEVPETRPVRKLPLRGLLQLSSVFLAGAVAGIVGIAYLPDIE